MGEIRKRYPDDAILTEESGAIAGGRAGASRWIVDPLDGTTNYAHQFPVYSVSIAREQEGRLECGVVFDPLRGETFRAVRGGGAWLDERRITVSDTAELGRGLLLTGFPYTFRDRIDEALGLFGAFLVRSQAVRRAGSAALDLCYVASGRADGFWELDLKPWDTAAGQLIVEEAGGRVSDFAGGSFGLGGRAILASNGRIHEEMLGVTAPGGSS